MSPPMKEFKEEKYWKWQDILYVFIFAYLFLLSVMFTILDLLFYLTRLVVKTLKYVYNKAVPAEKKKKKNSR